MTGKFGYIGIINNWMDLRDAIIKAFLGCDTELKFEKVLEGLLLSMVTSPKSINEIRERLGIEKLTKEEEEMINQMIKENNDDRKKDI